jgi:Ca-activated chloride channel family protein
VGPARRHPHAAASATSPGKLDELPTFAPPVPPRDTYFKHYGVNPTIDTEEENVSSFALDVDPASYAIARGALERDDMPEEAAVRIEEFVNAFEYDYPAPQDDDFAILTEMVASPHREGFHLLRIGLQAREVSDSDRAAANLVFVIDTSASMAKDDKLRLVKDGLRELVGRLGERDKVAIVAYRSAAEVVLPPTSGDRKEVIETALERLAPEGTTDIDSGLRLGYELAAGATIEGGINRVMLCTDGVASGRAAPSAEELLAHVAAHATRGISITTIGVGIDDYDDVLLEQLADRGGGNYAHIDRLAEAKRVLVDNLTGTLQIVARDAKLQVEFERTVVARYRLLGYENRALSPDAFTSEHTDAGEIGAGHAVTALYEVQLHRADADALGTIRLRYRRPHTGLPAEIVRPLAAEIRPSLAETQPATVLAMVVAAYAEKLRGSYWVRGLTWASIQDLHERIAAPLQDRPEVVELGELIDAAARLDRRPDRYDDDTLSPMEFERMPVLR